MRRALWRYARAAPRGGGDPRRVVILLSSAWGMGGTIRSALNLAGYLAQHREVEIITPYRRLDEPFFGAFPDGVEVSAMADERPGHGPKGLARLAYAVLRRRQSVLFPEADRLHREHSLWSDIGIARKLHGGRGILMGTRPGYNLMIAQLHAPGYVTVGLEQMNIGHHKRRLRRAIKRWYPELDAFVALTEQDAAAYEDEVAGRTAVFTIPNTVRVLGGPEIDHSAKVVMAAGRLGKLGQKGFDLVVRAWVPVAERCPDWRLRIVGEGPLRPRLESLIDELGLEGVVELPGAAQNMGEAMAEASMFVLSSRYEGFPLILLEAMSKGLPCVSFDCPTGPRDIIDDHENGVLVPAEDIDALSQAIIEVIGDEPLRRRLGPAAAATAREFTMEAIGPRWDRMLAELEGAPEPRRPVASSVGAA
jgi:glycosyltransferase involved in cell wall biosynthesis